MPRTKISEFSATAASNTDIDSINIAENCPPSGINDAIRELMAQLKDFQTGAVGDSFNGPVGTTTAAAGAFTTLSASGNVTLSGGTANGVAYLNGSKVVTSGSALTFNGSDTFAYGGSNAGAYNIFTVNNTSATGYSRINLGIGASSANGSGTIAYAPSLFFRIGTESDASSTPMTFILNGSEQMRLTSTGLGIGTSSPAAKLHVQATQASMNMRSTGTGNPYIDFYTSTSSLVGNIYGIDGGGMAIGTSGGTERLRVDSSGNLGLGVTPSAWGSAWKDMQISTFASFGGNSDDKLTAIGNNFYNDGIAKYIGTGQAALYSQYQGQHRWQTAASGTAGNAITFTQAMTLDASGNLGVGTSSPASKLDVNSTASRVLDITSSNASGCFLRLVNSSTALGYLGSAKAIFGNNLADLALDVSGANNLIFGTNDTERARIDSSGNLLLNTTSQLSEGKLCVAYSYANNQGIVLNETAGSAGQDAIRFNVQGTKVGSVSVTTTATAYNTSSDYRLKNITGPITNSGAYIDSLNPVEGTWKIDGSTFVGLIAHEAQEASRTKVATGVKDGDEMQGMSYSNSEMIANMIAELKSLRQRIATLEAK